MHPQVPRKAAGVRPPHRDGGGVGVAGGSGAGVTLRALATRGGGACEILAEDARRSWAEQAERALSLYRRPLLSGAGDAPWLQVDAGLLEIAP